MLQQLLKVNTAVFLLGSAALLLVGFACSPTTNRSISIEMQEDFDLWRLKSLVHWGSLVEEYFAKTGAYPLQSIIRTEDELGVVHILNGDQQPYFEPQSSKFREDLYRHNATHARVSALVSELENGLGRTIDEYYDSQLVPTTFPIGVHYFFNQKGYVMWVDCISCGVNKIGTMLMYADRSPTVTIASASLADPGFKFFEYDALINNPLFKSWIERDFHRDGLINRRKEKYLHDSKNASY